MPRSSTGPNSTPADAVADSEPQPTRCGYVALIGAPNSGKSTLLNRLVGHKLAIVTPKAQTTRTRLLGIAIEGAAQIIYVDTPGIFAPRRRLDRAMVAAAWSGAADAAERMLMGAGGWVGRREARRKIVVGRPRPRHRRGPPPHPRRSEGTRPPIDRRLEQDRSGPPRPAARPGRRALAARPFRSPI